jgi:Elongation-Factor P (EF-P) rhamnosyltransferase EarP
VPVIDNFGDLGFALELALDLTHRYPNIRVQVWSESPELYNTMLGDPIKYSQISYQDLAGFDVREGVFPIVTFFGYKISGQPAHLRRVWQCDYLQFSGASGSAAESTLRSFDGTSYCDGNLEYIHRVPALSQYGAGVVHRRISSWIPAIIPASNHKYRATVFVYDPTFEAITPIFEEFPDWEFLVLGWEMITRDLPSNCVTIPFIPITEMPLLYASADLNIVRGENTLITAVFADKPWLWDIYRESNGAHSGKLADCLDTLASKNALPLKQDTLTGFVQDPARILREVLHGATPPANIEYQIDWLPDLTKNMYNWIIETPTH